VDRPEDAIAPAVKAGGWGCREDGIAFELDQREVGLDAFDDGVQQVAQDRIGGGDTTAEVKPVLLLDARQEGGIARDVGQEEVPLACGGLRLARIGSDCLSHLAIIAA
jgi:hypothetical protein